MTGTVTHPNWKKLFMQMLIGAVAGAAATGGLLMVWEDRGFDLSDPAQLLALVAGMVYALMGVMVGLGALAPSTGARFLNVEDAGELREQRPVLILSAVACLLTGVFFLTLAAIQADGTSGLLSRETATLIAGASLVALVAMTRWTNRKADELTRQVSMESSALAMYAIMVLLGGWAALAHFGYVAWISPLAFVAGLALLQLAAIFWVAGKRGMLTRG